MFCSKLFSILFLSLSLTLIFIPCVISSTDSSVFNSFDKAEQSLTSSYDAVYLAEKSGANVTSLLNTLNIAGGYLSDAYAQNYLGNYENADYFAGLCRDLALDVEKNAENLQNSENLSENGDVYATQLGSIVAVISIIALSYVVWRVFKSTYHRRILRLKPEVGSDGS